MTPTTDSAQHMAEEVERRRLLGVDPHYAATTASPVAIEHLLRDMQALVRADRERRDACAEDALQTRRDALDAARYRMLRESLLTLSVQDEHGRQMHGTWLTEWLDAAIARKEPSA